MNSSFVSAPPSNEFGANSKSSLKRTTKLISSFQRTFAMSTELLVQGGAGTKQADFPYPELTLISVDLRVPTGYRSNSICQFLRSIEILSVYGFKRIAI